MVKEGTRGERRCDTRIPGRGMIEFGRACVLLRVSCSRSQYQRRTNPSPCILGTKGPIDSPSESQMIDPFSSYSYEGEGLNFNRRVHNRFSGLPIFSTFSFCSGNARNIFFFLFFSLYLVSSIGYGYVKRNRRAICRATMSMDLKNRKSISGASKRTMNDMAFRSSRFS